MVVKREKSKVIMLPTKDRSSNILKCIKSFLLDKGSKYEDSCTKDAIVNGVGVSANIEYFKHQHLYILSEGEPKEGDWVLYHVLKSTIFCEYLIGQVTSTHNNEISVSYWVNYNGEVEISTTNLSLTLGTITKIVATTDTSLRRQNIMMSMSSLYLPQPSQAFIKKYCELGGINEVMVEYEVRVQNKSGERHLVSDNDGEAYLKTCKVLSRKLKIDSHNTITIAPVKDSWSREEVEELCSLYDALVHNDFHVASSEDIHKRIKEIRD